MTPGTAVGGALWQFAAAPDHFVGLGRRGSARRGAAAPYAGRRHAGPRHTGQELAGGHLRCYATVMPELRPFAGLRPNTTITGRLDDVVCPPYDVISEEERLRLADRSPYNVVRVELPNGQYEEAARLLREWRASGVLAREEAPALYGYRMSYKSAGGARARRWG